MPIPTPTLGSVRVLPPKGLNNSVYLAINHFSRHTAWAHSFMHAYALWLGAVLLAAVFAASYAVAWWRRAHQAATLLILGGIGTVVALGLNQLVNHAARELRPYVAHPTALVLVAKTSDFSFPSDHSVVAGGLTLSLLLLLGRGAWRAPSRGDVHHDGIVSRTPMTVRVLAGLSVVLGLLLCFARVYVGAHYPGDVVAGYLLSAGVVIVCALLRPVAFRFVSALASTPLGILVRRPGAVARGAFAATEAR